jgi:hypothetical protein
MPTTQRRNSNGRNKVNRQTAPRSVEDLFSLPEQLQNDWGTTLRVLSKMRSDGISLSKAARQEGANARTVSRLAGRALKKRSNGSYAVRKTDSLLRVMQIPTIFGLEDMALRSSRDASRLAKYWDAVQKFLRTGDKSGIEKFRGKRIKDSRGLEAMFITDPAELRRLGFAGVLSFESIYARTA